VTERVSRGATFDRARFAAGLRRLLANFEAHAHMVSPATQESCTKRLRAQIAEAESDRCHDPET
jgi:hypothetical protein